MMENSLSAQVREATPGDAEELLLLTKENLSNSPYLVLKPSEFNLTVDQEVDWINNFITSPNNLLIVAVSGDKIIGNLSFYAGRAEKIKHVGEIAMAIKMDFRNQGVGSLLMDYFFEWVKSTQIRKVNLAVNELNTSAIHLYKKFGFIVEGVQKMEFFSENRYSDKILMGKIV